MSSRRRYIIVTAHFADTDDLAPVQEALRPLKEKGTVGSVASYDAAVLKPDPETGEPVTLNEMIDEVGLDDAALALVQRTSV